MKTITIAEARELIVKNGPVEVTQVAQPSPKADPIMQMLENTNELLRVVIDLIKASPAQP